MEVSGVGRLEVASLLWRRTAASWVQTVVCKATFDLLPGRARLSERQEPLHQDDRHCDGDPARSLHAPGDLVPLKARTDVLLVGRAFAPGGRPVRSLVARLGVGEMLKSVEVFGTRFWDADGSLREEAPFSWMSLAYERAAGGPDTWNPVGIRLDVQGDVALPNLQPVDRQLARRGDFVAPIGFGPIAPAWPHRAELLGRHRGSFSAAFPSEHPLPEDFDAGYFNAAPPDQQVEEIRADERLVLENLHPEHASLVTMLPGAKPVATLELAGAPPQKLRMRADTLWIDTERALCTVTWRGQIPLRRRDEAGRVVVALEEPGQSEAFDARRTAQLPRAAEVEEAVMTVPLDVGAMKKTVLPFVEAPARAEATHPPEPPAPPPSMPAPMREAPAPPRPPDTRASKIGAWIPPGAAPEDVGLAPTPLSVLAVSNAAAGAPSADREAASVEARRLPAADAVELIWVDPAFVPKIRRHVAWKGLLGDAKRRGRDDDGASREEQKAAKDERDVTAVLRRGEALDVARVEAALLDAMEEETFTPPLVLVAGELEVLFDEMEVLKATMAAVAPFVPGDKKLKEMVDVVGEVMKTPGIERARGIIAGLIARVKEAFAPAGRGVPAAYLEAQTEPMLLEGRCYQKRAVMGASYLRGVLRMPGEREEALPAYLAEGARNDLPMFRRIAVRVIAEARGRVDQHDAADVALKVGVLGRRLAQR